jgi:glucose/arabinose dehydrogenase
MTTSAKRVRRSRERLLSVSVAALLGIGFGVAASVEGLAQTQQQGEADQQLQAQQPPYKPQRQVNPDDIQLADGYRIEAVAAGLNFPSDITFGEDGTIYVSETGPHEYGLKPPQAPQARILKLNPDGGTEVLYDNNVPIHEIRKAEKSSQMPEGLIGPIEGITYNPENGLIYVAHRTRVSTLNPDTGEFKTIIHDLPAWGFFHNTKVIFDEDGKMVFGVSTQSNAGPVDKEMLEVTISYQKFKAREVPCEDVTLTGQNLPVPVPEPFPKDAPVQPDSETPDGKPAITSGVYVALGEKTEPGQVIKGEKLCNGAMYRADPDGSNIERIAWGFRNTFEYAFAPDGRLIATNNSGNPIPPRPVFNDWETIYEVQEGQWYGWPDYYSSEPITESRFSEAPADFPGKVKPHKFALTEDTHRKLLGDRDRPVAPLVKLAPHAASQGFTFASNGFGLSENEVLVANYGTLVLFQSDEKDPPGFNIARVNLETGDISIFAENKSGKPASMENSGGLERPLRVRFGTDGALYVVDWGVLEFKPPEALARLNTGVIWKITKQ